MVFIPLIYNHLNRNINFIFQDFSTSNSSGSRESLRCHDSGYSSTDRLNSQSATKGGRGQFTGQFTGHGQNSAGKWSQPQYARQNNQISNQNDRNHHSTTNNNYRVELPLHQQITHSGKTIKNCRIDENSVHGNNITVTVYPILRKCLKHVSDLKP